MSHVDGQVGEMKDQMDQVKRFEDEGAEAKEGLKRRSKEIDFMLDKMELEQSNGDDIMVHMQDLMQALIDIES